MNKDLEKYFTQELEPSERIEILRKINSDPSLQEDFIEQKNALGMMALSLHDSDEKEGEWSYDSFVVNKRKKQYRKLVLNTLKYASAIIFIIGCTWYASLFFYSRYPSEEMLAENTVTAPAGQRSSIMLNDGTQIWLNANSSLTYPSVFSGGTRNVKIKGEAYFIVAKDEKKPFVVSTSVLDVKVLGTTFSIEDYPSTDSVSVNLIEGKVEVYAQSDVNKKIILQPMQKVSYREGDFSLSDFNDHNSFLWKDGIYSFDKTPLNEIAKKLELYFDTKIILEKESIKNYRFTGKFRQRDGVVEILKIMQKIHRFDIVKDDENNTIILR